MLRDKTIDGKVGKGDNEPYRKRRKFDHMEDEIEDVESDLF
jgi:hypothetical protein